MENGPNLTKKLHILFVDDERLIREMVSDMLSDSVGHVSLANNGQEGLDFYQNSVRPVDIVISDQTMPVMNGLDMLERIKKTNPAQKCIMITAHSEAKYMLRAIELGIEHFLIKPISFDRLDAILYDLALKIEQEAFAKEQEKQKQRTLIHNAFAMSCEKLVGNIPIPSLVIDEHDRIVAGNSEIFSIAAGTSYHKKLMDKETDFKTLFGSEWPHGDETPFCDWKEETLMMSDERYVEIESTRYLLKIKRILSDDNKRFYVVCFIESVSQKGY